MPDLILIDIRMPGMDGFAVCRALKVDPYSRDITAIFVNARQDQADLTAAFTAALVPRFAGNTQIFKAKSWKSHTPTGVASEGRQR